MANRPGTLQPEHDGAVEALAKLYAEKGKLLWTNPNGEKNKSWIEQYIDLIVVESADDFTALLIEVETADSVSDEEAINQWKSYDSVFTLGWNLAVPVERLNEALRLTGKHQINNCYVFTWRKLPDGSFKFFGLPAL